jgi:glycosyltransferase involved in cell wall biosynthesis
VLPDYKSFDAIVAHGDSLLLPLTGKPLMRVLHGSALGEARSARTVGRLVLQWGVYFQEILTALLQNGVVAVSDSTRRDNPFVRHVIPHGIDDGVFRPNPAARTGQPSVVFVGTLKGRKRGQFLLDLFQNTVRAMFSNAVLTIVGDKGPPSPGVEYRVGVSDSELAFLYQRAWVYASPSTYEGFGLPYLEAMACGTPVVATRNAGSEEVLGGGAYGALASDTDFGRTLLSLLGDRQSRGVLATRGADRAQMYSLEAMLTRYEELLFELIQLDAKPVASA